MVERKAVSLSGLLNSLDRSEQRKYGRIFVDRHSLITVWQLITAVYLPQVF